MLDLFMVPAPAKRCIANTKAIRYVRPSRAPRRDEHSYHNNGDGTFSDVSEKAGILNPGPRYSITAVSCDLDNDGWPGHLRSS